MLLTMIFLVQIFFITEKSDDYLEIIEVGKAKYKSIYRVCATVVYLKKDKDSDNIHYDAFKLIDNDLNKITPFECKEKNG